MYRLNLSEDDKGFHEAVTIGEMFKGYRKQWKYYRKKKKRNIQKKREGRRKRVISKMRTSKNPKVRDLHSIKINDLPRLIFSRAVDRVITGVLRSEFIFKFPGSTGTLKMIESKDPITDLSYHRYVDAFESRFKFYYPILEVQVGGKLKYYRHNYIKFSKKYKDILKEELESNSVFQTFNTINTRDLAYIMKEEYFPDYDIRMILEILKDGFSVFLKASRSQIDFCIFQKSENINERVTDYLYFANYKTPRKLTRVLHYIRKVRFLYRHYNKPYSGYYYAALTNKQANTFDKVGVEVRLYRVLEEAMLNPHIYPHIIAVKIIKPYLLRMTFSKEIKYEKNNTEYLWRWNDKRFESVDYTEFFFNRHLKWDSDHL